MLLPTANGAVGNKVSSEHSKTGKQFSDVSFPDIGNDGRDREYGLYRRTVRGTGRASRGFGGKCSELDGGREGSGISGSSDG
jgi:hypothetical protein